MTTRVKRAMNCSDWPEPNKWRFATYKCEVLVQICCPECGHVATLLDHAIYDDGEVEPGVVCNECNFSDEIILDMFEAIDNPGRQTCH